MNRCRVVPRIQGTAAIGFLTAARISPTSLERFSITKVQARPRVVRGTRAIMQILDCFREGYWHWISSEVLVTEVNRASNLEQRIQIKRWLTRAHQTILVGAREITRARQLEALGFKELDALHIAGAERSKATIFLTTDDAILRRSKRDSLQLHIRVENPYGTFRNEGLPIL